MNKDSYFVAKTNTYALIHRIGDRDMTLVSDTSPDDIQAVYRKIQNEEYPSEQAMFQDIFDRFSGKSVLPQFRADA